jgi:hypothetical protein
VADHSARRAEASAPAAAASDRAAGDVDPHEPSEGFTGWAASMTPALLEEMAGPIHLVASPGRRAPFREFALSVSIDFSGALKVA